MAPADSPRTTRAVKLRFILTAVILVALIPPLFLLSLAIWRAGEADRAAANAQFLSQARAMSSMFASALRANIAVVHAVAELDNDTGGSIDRLSGVSSIFSAEIAPTGADPAYPAAPAEAGGWTASNLFGIETGVKAKLAITLRTGFGDGDTLTLVMDPRQLTRALRFDTGAYGQTLVAVVDGNGRVIARSREVDRFIGAPVPTWNALLDVNAPSGIFKAELLEGDTITFAFSTIPGTPGWVVVAGVPSAILDTRWGEPLRYFVGGSIAAVLAGAGLALLVASRIARPLSALAAYAETTTGGTPGTPPGRTPISEYETLRDTLIEAQHRLLDRANRSP